MTRKAGEAIVYALTIPKVARRSDLAEKYVSFIVGATGRQILAREYIQPVDQPWTFDPDRVPAAIRSELGVRDRSPALTSSPGDSHAR